MMYCPICQREIAPELVYGNQIWIHDDVVHPENWADDPFEFAAMMAGLQ